MEAEAQRIERRLQEWTLQAARNKDAREAKHAVIAQKREEAARLEAEHEPAEAALDEQQAQAWLTLRQTREALQQEAAQVTAELAELEERRRGAEAAFQRIDRLHADLERRVLAIEQQRAAAEAEREQRIARERRAGGARAGVDGAAGRGAGPGADAGCARRRRCASSLATWKRN